MRRRKFISASAAIVAGAFSSRAVGSETVQGNARKYGWDYRNENVEAIDLTGLSPDVIMSAMRQEEQTPFNVSAPAWNTLQFQGNQGACAGHAIAHMSQIVLTQNTGIKRMFSRANGYYEAQRKDGIIGDTGATISACTKVMSDGMMLEEHWPYPSKYDNTRPTDFEDAPRLRVPHTRTLTNADEVWEFLLAGGVVQTGVMWGPSYEEMRADECRGMGYGGHSTILYGFDPNDPDWCVHHNSWDGWGIDGRSYWSKNFIKGCLEQRWNILVGYQAVGLGVDKDLWDV